MERGEGVAVVVAVVMRVAVVGTSSVVVITVVTELMIVVVVWIRVWTVVRAAGVVGLELGGLLLRESAGWGIKVAEMVVSSLLSSTFASDCSDATGAGVTVL